MKAGFLVTRYGKAYIGLIDTKRLDIAFLERIADVKKIFETKLGIYFLDRKVIDETNNRRTKTRS